MREDDPRQLIVKIAETLERLKIPYLITGGMAVLVWGRPRFTADEDVESIFQISGKKLDRGYLKDWAEKLGVSKLLAKFLKK